MAPLLQDVLALILLGGLYVWSLNNRETYLFVARMTFIRYNDLRWWVSWTICKYHPHIHNSRNRIPFDIIKDNIFQAPEQSSSISLGCTDDIYQIRALWVVVVGFLWPLTKLLCACHPTSDHTNSVSAISSIISDKSGLKWPDCTWNNQYDLSANYCLVAAACEPTCDFIKSAAVRGIFELKKLFR